MIKFIRILVFLGCLISISAESYAKDLAVMLYVPDKSYGDQIYSQYLKAGGLTRNLNNNTFNYEYHVTLGYIMDVKPNDIVPLKKFITKELSKETSNVVFEFGVAALLGRDIAPYIIAIPANAQLFINLNLALESALKSFHDGKYKLNRFTLPQNYIPHMSLNSKVHKNIKMVNLANTLLTLNKNMAGAQIKLNKIEIR